MAPIQAVPFHPQSLAALFGACVLSLWPGTVHAADVSHYRLLKTKCNIQPNSITPVPSILPFGFWAQVWLGTNFSVNSASVTAPNFSVIFLSGGSPQLLSSIFPFASQASLDSLRPAGNYRLTLNTIHQGTTNLTLSLPTAAYPVAPRISNHAALQSIDPSAECVVSWDAFAGGTSNDLVELQILNSAGIVYATGAYPGAPGALSGQATSAVIPANTLVAGRSYVGRLAFVRITATNYAYAPGFAAYAQQTDFYLAAAGATPPVVVSAIPFIGAANVPGNAKVVFTFNKPMRNSHSYRVLGSTNQTSRTWSADQMTLTLTSPSPWPANVAESWYLNFFGGPLGFGDTNDSPLMTDTLATIFTAGSSNLPATPLSPRLGIANPPGTGAVQIQLTGGEAYRSYQFQASGDLKTWFPLSTVTATNSSFMFTDPTPPATNRHYRVAALP